MSERVSGASKQANRRSSGPVLQSVFLAVFDHSAVSILFESLEVSGFTVGFTVGITVSIAFSTSVDLFWVLQFLLIGLDLLQDLALLR